MSPPLHSLQHSRLSWVAWTWQAWPQPRTQMRKRCVCGVCLCVCVSARTQVPGNASWPSHPLQDVFDALEEWLTTPVRGDSSVSEFPLLYMKRYSEHNRGVHCRVDIPVPLAWCAAVLSSCFRGIAVALTSMHDGRLPPCGLWTAAARDYHYEDSTPLPHYRGDGQGFANGATGETHDSLTPMPLSSCPPHQPLPAIRGETCHR